MGAVLSEIGTVVFALYAPSVLAKLAFNVAVILLTGLTAVVLSDFKEPLNSTSRRFDGIGVSDRARFSG
jgi:hypothetical protein